MYLSFFSLHQKPFELLPNPDFLYLSDVHKKALTFLQYGLMEHTGFILFTGEVGTGKTTTIRRLLGKVSADMTVATVFNTQVDSVQLLRMINDDFGLASSSNAKAELLRDLNEFLIAQYAAGRRCVLIIDEAQNLGLEQLEEIRLLSNLETAHAKLLQIILVGQPELRDKLSSADLIQLRQRILVHCHLSPLSAENVASYILHRLEQSGNRDALDWQKGTLELVHEATRGVPRLINILCDYILLDAFTKGQNVITFDDLETILTQLDFESQFWAATTSAKEEPTPLAQQNPSPIREQHAQQASGATWTPEQVDGLCTRMQSCLDMMQQSLVSLSQLIVLLSQTVVTETEKKAQSKQNTENL